MEYINQYEVEALLGRSLSRNEESNYDLYIEIAITKLEDLMCRDLESIINDLSLDEIPADLKLVLARFFGSLSLENAQEIGVETKRVEDFSISYNENANKVFSQVVQQNYGTIAKYSKCMNIRSGRTLREECRYYDNLR